IFDLKSSNFTKNCNFYNTSFVKYNDFRFTTFNQSVNFSKAKFNYIDFSDTNFLSFVDFSEISNIENKQIECKKIKNRKTARVLKSKLDEANNIIESNYFYSIEMKKREEELEEDLKYGKNFFEWMVFKIHGLSSNHSQDWLLSLFWILSFTFTFLTIEFVNTYYLTHTVDYILIDMIIFLGFVYGNYLIIEYKKINKFYYIGIYYIFYGFFSQDWLLKFFSNKLNPFSIMTGNEELTFSALIYKIIIAYLIYQFIVSIRQNTRRK
ncbi:pentapeptide repeat-containing protein, partial [Aliarcobacter skirrowii]